MAKNSRQLPLVIDIPEPCGASWDAMTGDGQVRHCARCDKDVHTLDGLSEARIASLLARGACVRLQVAPDGAVVHRERNSSRAARVVATAALAALAACGKHVGGDAQVVSDPVPVTASAVAPAVAVVAPPAVEVAPLVEPTPAPSGSAPHLMGAPPIRPIPPIPHPHFAGRPVRQ